MKIRLFRAFPDSFRKSMTIYADRLRDGVRTLLDEGEEIDDCLLPGARLQPRAARYWDQYVRYQRYCHGRSADLNHVIDHGYGHLVSALPAERTVVTFHDSTVTKVGGASRGTRLSLSYSLRSIRKAAAVITDSESSRHDFLKLVSYPAEKVHVVYPGVDGSFKVQGERENLRGRLGLPGRYVLHVGHCLPYMNVEGVLLTLDQLVRRHKVDVSLVKVGGQFSRQQQAMIERLGLGGRILHLGRVPFTDLPAIYNCADVLLYPALYAGFGLPPLEAMACGTPVVCSDRGSLPEVTDGAAVTADPERAPDMAERVAGLMFDQRLRDEHVAKGLRQATRYSWERTAVEALSVYRSVLNA